MSTARTEAKMLRSGSCCTQRVTARDLKRGQIRIPSTGTSSAKSLFPATGTAVSVVLRSRSLEASWDPRMGPEREHSGVLRINKTICRVSFAKTIVSLSLRPLTIPSSSIDA